MRLAREIAGTFVARLASVALTAVVGIAVSRALGPEGKGLFVLYLLPLQQVAAFGGFGVPHGLIRSLARRPDAKGPAVGHYLVASLLAAFALQLPYWGLVAAVPALHAGTMQSGVLLGLSTALLPLSMTSFASGMLRGVRAIRRLNVLTVSTAAVGSGALLAALWSGSLRPETYAVVTGLAIWAGGLLATIVVLAAFRASPILSRSFSVPAIRFGIESYPGSALQMIERRADILLLGLLLPAAAVASEIGLYSVAVALADLPRSLAVAVSTALLPALAQRSSPAERARDAMRASRHLLAASLACSLPVALGGYGVIQFALGSRFAGAVVPFLILLPGVLAHVLMGVFQAELVAAGHATRFSANAAITLGLNVGLNVVAIPLAGVEGAAMASVLSYSLGTLLLLRGFRKRHPLATYRQMLLLDRTDLRRLSGRIVPAQRSGVGEGRP